MGRPHYHSLIFGYGFPDRKFYKETKAGESLYLSKQLDDIWGLGYTSVGDVTFGSAAYVARYHLKKTGSVVSKDHYVRPDTGEFLAPEYITMSRGSGDGSLVYDGGIGSGWIKKYMSDVYPRDSRVIKGVDTKPCKFYDSRYELSSPDGFRRVKLARLMRVNRADNTDVRLEVKEKVKLAQIASLSNDLEEIYK